MKKLILTGLLLLICPINGFSQATTGYHRVSQVLARAPQNVQAQVVPYAKIAVSITPTGAAAVIYSDPGLSVQITPPVLTSDVAGNYDYYLPVNYMVTETISSPGQGNRVISNVGEQGGGGTVTISGTMTAGSVYVSASGALSLAQANANMSGFCFAISSTQCLLVGTYKFSSSQGWTVGGTIYLSDTIAGAISQTSPTTPGSYVVILGTALAGDTILIQPQMAGVL